MTGRVVLLIFVVSGIAGCRSATSTPPPRTTTTTTPQPAAPSSQPTFLSGSLLVEPVVGGTTRVTAEFTNTGAKPVYGCARSGAWDPKESPRPTPSLYYAGGGTLVIFNGLNEVARGVVDDGFPHVLVQQVRPGERVSVSLELPPQIEEETPYGSLWTPHHAQVAGEAHEGGRFAVARVLFVQVYWRHDTLPLHGSWYATASPAPAGLWFDDRPAWRVSEGFHLNPLSSLRRADRNRTLAAVIARQQPFLSAGSTEQFQEFEVVGPVELPPGHVVQCGETLFQEPWDE
jgi:hypothetical protein